MGGSPSPSLILSLMLLLLLFICRSGRGIEENPNDLPASANETSSGSGEVKGAVIEPPPGEDGKDSGLRDEAGEGEAKKVPDEESAGVGDGKDKPAAEESDGGADGGKGEGSDPQSLDARASGVDECDDPSNRCVVEANKLVACLRVPGIDSSALSLLIQNKGNQSLALNIIAPDFVNLELRTMQLEAKEDKELKVLIEDGANDTEIVLKAELGQCGLSLRNLIPDNSKKSEASSLSRYIRISRNAPYVYMLLAAVVVVGAAWMLVIFRRWNLKETGGGGGGPRYQRVEMALPVSNGGRKEADAADDGWDSNWGDVWDDEEAPATPSRPPSTPSSMGLASRKSIKDGWKD